MTPPADIVSLRMPVHGDAIHVKPPDAAEMEDLAAIIELAAACLSTDGVALANDAPLIGSPEKWRDAQAALATAEAWLTDWTAVVAYARTRLSISLDQKERYVL